MSELVQLSKKLVEMSPNGSQKFQKKINKYKNQDQWTWIRPLFMFRYAEIYKQGYKILSIMEIRQMIIGAFVINFWNLSFSKSIL